MFVPEPATRRALAALAISAAVLAAFARALAGDAIARAPDLPCTRAVLVDQMLRCDAAAPRRVGEVCGDADSTPIRIGDAITTTLRCGGDPAGHGRMSPAELRALALPVDINAAGVDELESLPGIGSALAARWVAGRPYRSIEELLRVRGIGPKTLAKLRPRLVLEP